MYSYSLILWFDRILRINDIGGAEESYKRFSNLQTQETESSEKSCATLKSQLNSAKIDVTIGDESLDRVLFVY